MFRTIKNECDKYSAIVYSCSYESPIAYLSEIEKQVEELGVVDGYVLFDTLLSKGNISTKFQGGKFLKPTFKNINITKKSHIRKISSEFYKDSGINLDNLLLTDIQKRIISKGFSL